MPPLKDTDNVCSELKVQSASKDQANGNAFVNEKFANKVLFNLNTLREQGRFCDVEIIAGNQKYQAHKSVLSASSCYFGAMFEFGLEGKQKSIVLHTINPDIFKLIIEFIYTGSVQIHQDYVQELFAAADMLQLQEIVDGCCDFLVQQLHPTNALGILRFSQAHNCEFLSKKTLDYVYQNFTAITLEDEFLETPQNLVIQLLSAEFLKVESESEVFNAAMRWIKHDITTRRCFVFEMFSHVRLALVPIKVIDQGMKNCSDMSVKIALRSICRDIAAKRGLLAPLRISPRISAKKHIYIIGGSSRTNTGWHPGESIFETVAKFDIFRREWSETVAPMQIGRILPGVAVLNGKIVVVGGERGSQILANGEMYDPQNDKWSPISPMIVPRCEFGLCCLSETLYALGGWIGDDIGGSVEAYDPNTDSWSMVGNLPEPRFSMGVVSFEGLIYIVGGCTTASRHLTDLISYNPVTKEWVELSHMNTARCQMGVAILDRHLYVVGGNNSTQDVLSSVEKYSFDEDKWTTVCPMSVCRAIPAVASADGILYVAGGDQTCEVNFYRAQVTISSVECYDPLNDTWKNCPDLPLSRSEAGAVVL